MCAPDAVKKGAHAGNIVREVAKIAGGSGGGKAESAMAGGKDAAKLEEALNSAERILADLIGG
jgi:alanyl-tRNA synthetase